MSKQTFEPHQWAVILGGSSGFGLAAAKKLARHGMNLCIAHRDRRGAMRRIEPEFDALRAEGVSVETFNADALRDDAPAEILDALQEVMGGDGEVRVLLHSIAFGNLKLIGPDAPSSNEASERLAAELGVERDRIREVADRLFAEGVDGLQGLASPPEYPEGMYLEAEDMARTVYAMGTSLLSWTQEIVGREMFGADARVLGLTSEGNAVAWKGYAAVSAAKAALEAVSRAIAVELAHLGLRSNIIQAGVTDTPALRVIPGSAYLTAQARTRNPFKRLTTPDDVADVIYLLALPESAWINGDVIRVDGGESVSGASR